MSISEWMTEVSKKRPAVEAISGGVTLAAKVSLPVGFIYLFFYCSYYRIPVPIQISTLPSLLVVMAMLGAWLTSITGAFVMVPGILRSNMLGPGYSVLYRQSRGRVRCVFLVILAPVTLIIFGFFSISLLSGLQLLYSILTMAIGVACLLGGVFRRVMCDHSPPREMKRKEALMAAVAHMVVCVVWAVMAMVCIHFWSSVPDRLYAFFLRYFSDSVSMFLVLFIESLALAGVAAGLVWVGAIDLYSSRRRLPEVSLWGFMLVWMFVISISSPFLSKWVAGTLLAALGVGGGRAECFSVTEAMPDDVKKIFQVDESGNTRYPLRIGLAVGDHLFVIHAFDDARTGRENQAAIDYPASWFRNGWAGRRMAGDDGRLSWRCPRPTPGSARAL